MEILFMLLLISFPSAVVGIGFNVYRMNAVGKAFRALSDKLGFSFSGKLSFFSPEITGKIDENRLGALKLQKDGKTRLLRISVTCTQTFPFFYSIYRKNALKLFQDAFKASGAFSGDKSFDEDFQVSVPESQGAALLGLLNREAKRRILEFDELLHHIDAKSRGIHFYFRYSGVEPGLDLLDLYNRSLVLSGLIHPPRLDTRGQLLRNLRTETGKAKVLNLKALLARYPMDREIEEDLTTLLGSHNLEMRYIAATRLATPESHQVLLEMIPVVPLSRRLDIIGYMRTRKVSLCLSYFTQSFTVLDKDSRNAVLELLGEIGSPREEGFLLNLLKEGGSSLPLIVKALENTGTIKSVEPLYYLARKNSLNLVVKNLAQRAIGAIQGRIGIEDRGWLSVTGQEEMSGALSLEVSGPGALSLDKEKEDNEPGEGGGNDA